MTKEIELSQGYAALVDDDKLEWLRQWKWHAIKKRQTVYAQCWNGGNQICMHQLLLPCESDFELDHVDGNGLNNQMSNLRIATRSQNAVNYFRHNITGYRGIRKVRNSWAAHIKKDGRDVYIGCFPSPEEAARAYDKAATELHGEFAWLNFPQEQTA